MLHLIFYEYIPKPTKINTFVDTINVCNYLYYKYGIDIGTDNENIIVWPKNFKEGGARLFFLVVFALLLLAMLMVIKLWMGFEKGSVIITEWTDKMIRA